MNTFKIVAVVLVILGILGLAFGSFTYTKDIHNTKLGPFSFSIKDKETINIPVWAGIVSVVVGLGLLLVKPRKA